MIFEYFPDTDTLYIYIALRPGPGADAEEVAPDVILVRYCLAIGGSGKEILCN